MTLERPRQRTRLLPILLATVTGSVVHGQDAPVPVGKEAFGVVASLYDYDREIPLQARVVDREELPGCTREKIVFRARDRWVVGYLGIPKDGQATHPCVLALHGIGADKSSWWDDDSFARGGALTTALLRDGFAVFTPDAEYHGERTHDNEFERGWMNRVRDMIVQSVVDCRRAVDYLQTRPDIDATRIGLIGYSMGGIEAFPLAALDHRIQVTVACVTSISHIDEAGGGPLLESRNFAHALGDRPFLMLMGRSDPACTVAAAQRVHDRIPGEKKRLVFYDSGHRLPAEYVEDARAWLAKALTRPR